MWWKIEMKMTHFPVANIHAISKCTIIRIVVEDLLSPKLIKKGQNFLWNRIMKQQLDNETRYVVSKKLGLGYDISNFTLKMFLHQGFDPIVIVLISMALRGGTFR